MKIYIAGPMTGYKDFNYPAFNRAQAVLEALGHEVENPASGGQVDGWTWADYMRRGITQMLTCDAVVLLPKWIMSRGAATEHQLASKLGLPIWGLGEFIDNQATGEEAEVAA